jgi:hypothetical protein
MTSSEVSRPRECDCQKLRRESWGWVKCIRKPLTSQPLATQSRFNAFYNKLKYIQENMCTQTLIIFACCPCRKTRISTCISMQDQEYRAWRHFQSIPDYRGCKGLETLEDFNEGCCEMAHRGTCPYAGGNRFDTPKVPRPREDKLGIYPGK